MYARIALNLSHRHFATSTFANVAIAKNNQIIIGSHDGKKKLCQTGKENTSKSTPAQKENTKDGRRQLFLSVET
jgi:hypothetical protein